jgi:hypothetical protein
MVGELDFGWGGMGDGIGYVLRCEVGLRCVLEGRMEVCDVDFFRSSDHSFSDEEDLSHEASAPASPSAQSDSAPSEEAAAPAPAAHEEAVAPAALEEAAAPAEPEEAAAPAAREEAAAPAALEEIEDNTYGALAEFVRSAHGRLEELKEHPNATEKDKSTLIFFFDECIKRLETNIPLMKDDALKENSARALDRLRGMQDAAKLVMVAANSVNETSEQASSQRGIGSTHSYDPAPVNISISGGPHKLHSWQESRATGRSATRARGAVRCGAVRCGAVRCGAVRCGAVRCGAVRCGAA